jgi:hypothetical protein
MRLYRIGRFERGVFAEIGADRRATWQGLAIVVVASLAGGWRFLRKQDGDWQVADWLLDEGGTAIAGTIAAALLLWTIARIAGGRGSIIALWRGIAFAISPIILGVLGFDAQLVGAAVAVPFYVWVVAETQTVGIRVGMLAVATPVLLYAAFFLYYAVSID